MYLKRLELHGFKSFADKTVLEFMPGITVVIGPNGSGKSNIADSIRWVLGEQSMKSLRGAKSEDIIFAGTETRKSLGFAEASIVIDNTDGKLPIDYNEVTVTRRIYRSGDSGYYINKAPCRLKDIAELFMDTGIGKDGYSIIGQGKIDEILSNKSEERRHIFEEAAGIVKYRARKEESEKKLEQTQLNLVRIHDILVEIEGNLEPLQKQSEKAKKYLALRESLKNIEVGLFVHDIQKNKEAIAKIVQDLTTITEQHQTEEQSLQIKQEDKERLKQEIEKIQQNLEDEQQKNFETTRNIEKANADIALYGQKIEINQENKQRYDHEIQELAKKLDSLQQEKEGKLAKQNNLAQEKEKYEKELAEKQAIFEKMTSQFTQEEMKIEKQKEQVSQLVDERYETMSHIQEKKINNENLEKNKKNLQEEIYQIISELDAKKIEKQELVKDFRLSEEKKKKQEEALQEIEKQTEEWSRQLAQYEENRNKMLAECNMKQSRLKFLEETEREKEGYAKSVKSLLLAFDRDSQLAQGVHGVLADLLAVPQKYQTAIEIALGSAMQNIVTQSEGEAKTLIQYLRDHRLGRASFLPITAMKGKKLERIDQKNIDGVMGIASDLVQYDKTYQNVVEQLLGRTVIVDQMDHAIALAKKNHYGFRIVTLQGDVVNPSGVMTGGSVANKTVNLLGRKQEIESLKQVVQNMQQELEQEKQKKEAEQEKRQAVLEQAETMEKAMQEIQIACATKQQKLDLITQEISKKEDQLKQHKNKLEQIEQENKQNQQEKEGLEKAVLEMDQNMEKANAVIQEYAQKNKDNQKNIDDLNFEITNLKISVTSFHESGMSIQEMIDRVEEDMKMTTHEKEQKQKLCEEMTNNNQNYAKKMEESREKMIQLQETQKQDLQQMEQEKQEKIQKDETLKKTEDEILEQYHVLNELKEQINKIELKKSKVELELEQIVNKLWEEYELTPNNVTDYQKVENIQEVQKQVTKIRGEIRALGSINVDAIEEYKQAKQRYDFMTEQKNDLEESSDKLKKVIADMLKIMEKQFKDQFRIINRNFGEIFAELFGGGKAELSLTDDNVLECGIEIEAQPPGKKLQNMMLLSGGEKALTAIALLFAILKINPAPFCVLDEIEAALDDVNVYRYAEYLKKFTKEIQFLVITHRKGTMEAADTVYGITMEEKGISKLLSLKLK